MLTKKCDVHVSQHHGQITPEHLVKNVRDVDALLSLVTDTIDRRVIDAGNRLKIISNCAVGYNNIDVDYATHHGIMVTNTPGVLTNTTAELTWALIFAVGRKIVPADGYVRRGLFTGWDPLLYLGYDISGLTLGIIGMGRIGQAVARMSAGFNMKIVYSDPREIVVSSDLEAEHIDLCGLANQADIITVHVPLLPETKHLCNDQFFQCCKKNAIFINTSRGPVVAEKALAEALDAGRIAGAGLDVYEHEPDIHEKLINRENVVLLPHIGSATFQTRARMSQRAAQNILDLFQPKTPQFLVNQEVISSDHRRKL